MGRLNEYYLFREQSDQQGELYSYLLSHDALLTVSRMDDGKVGLALESKIGGETEMLCRAIDETDEKAKKLRADEQLTHMNLIAVNNLVSIRLTNSKKNISVCLHVEEKEEIEEQETEEGEIIYKLVPTHYISTMRGEKRLIKENFPLVVGGNPYTEQFIEYNNEVIGNDTLKLTDFNESSGDVVLALKNLHEEDGSIPHLIIETVNPDTLVTIERKDTVTARLKDAYALYDPGVQAHTGELPFPCEDIYDTSTGVFVMTSGVQGNKGSVLVENALAASLLDKLGQLKADINKIQKTDGYCVAPTYEIFLDIISMGMDDILLGISKGDYEKTNVEGSLVMGLLAGNNLHYVAYGNCRLYHFDGQSEILRNLTRAQDPLSRHIQEYFPRDVARAGITMDMFLQVMGTARTKIKLLYRWQEIFKKILHEDISIGDIERTYWNTRLDVSNGLNLNAVTSYTGSVPVRPGDKFIASNISLINLRYDQIKAVIKNGGTPEKLTHELNNRIKLAMFDENVFRSTPVARKLLVGEITSERGLLNLSLPFKGKL